MDGKKPKWSPIKEILFSYLAINKILYWFGVATDMGQSDLASAWQPILMRILNQDLPLIISLVVFYFLEKLIRFKKSKYSNVFEQVVFYIIGYLSLLGVAFAYMGIMFLVFGSVEMNWGAFVGYITLSYIVVAMVLSVKEYFKGRAKPGDTPIVQTSDRIAMLETLRNEGVLTAEEFEQKKDFVAEEKCAK